jgi:hypothetical protein
MSYDRMGYHRLPPISAEQREREMARIREKDEAAARSHAAWNRLCGIAPMIGGPSER